MRPRRDNADAERTARGLRRKDMNGEGKDGDGGGNGDGDGGGRRWRETQKMMDGDVEAEWELNEG